MSLAVTMLGVSVLAGWMLDVSALKSGFSVPVTMRASAALGFILSGAAMMLVSGQIVTKPIRIAAMLLAVLVLALGTTTLAEEFFGWELGIDEWLVRLLGKAEVISGPGRISPPAAFCFVLTGAAIAIAGRPVPLWARLPLLSGLGAALIVVGAISLVGHVSNAVLGFRILNYVRMAAYTAGGFVLIGATLLVLVRSEGGLRWSLDSFATSAFIVGIAAVLMAASSSFNLTAQMRQVTAQVTHSQETLKEIEEIISGAASLNNGQRGYVITGDPRLLEQRPELQAGIEEDIAHVRTLSGGNIDQSQRLDQLSSLFAQRFAWDERTIAARRDQGFPAAQQLIATGTGMTLNGRIQGVLKEIEVQEYQLLDQRQKEADAIAAKTFLLLPIEAFVGLTMLTLGLFFLNGGIGERKRVENALRTSEALFHRTFDSMLEGCQLIAFDWRYLYVNTSVTAQCRRTKEELLGHRMMEVFPGIEDTPMFAVLRRCMEQRTPHRMENRFDRHDGSIGWFDLSIQPIPEGLLVVSADITARKAEAEKLHESELRFRQLTENIREVFWLTDSAKNEMLYVSPAYDEIWGRRLGDLYANPLDWINAVHPEDRERVLEATRTKQARGDYFEEYRIVRPDGSIRWISDKAFPIADGDGRVTRVAGIAEDITAQRRVLDALRESERRFSDMLGNVEMISLMFDCDARIIYCNDYLLRLTGWERDEVIGRSWFEVFIPPENQDAKEAFAALIENLPSAWHYEYVILTKSGERRLIRWNNSVLRSGSGAVTGAASIGEDITERAQAVEAQTRLAAIVEFSDDGIIGQDANGIVTSWNAGATKIFGYTAAEMVGQPIIRLLPPDRVHEEESILSRIKRGENVENFETVRNRNDGQLIDVSITVSPIRDANGNVVGASKIARDISERKRLENQLRHSQKMEAIGQLTGGIAHDFNNLLGVILGNLDLLERLVGDNDAALRRVQIAQKAGARGADLAGRMLAFSSHQPLHPAATSLLESIGNTLEMAGRALGPEIRITTSLDKSIPAVFIDAAGLENALLNLVVNARDAMPRGGSLTVSTDLAEVDDDYPSVKAGELKPGRYALVAVSDTGHGMSSETRDRAFEPFFTTKPRGKGTGLGLSMVYGFAKQSGGTAKIYSELGHGTTVAFYLPLADQVPAAATKLVEPVAHVETGGTVLVVDDEVDLLEIAVAYLADMGYRVLHATDAAAALVILDREPQIDLLVTDVIMPGGMNGVELAQKVSQLWPLIKVVYSSGYPSRALNERNGLRVDGPLLYKPFSRADFVTTVRNALASGDAEVGDGAAVGA